MLKSFFYCAGAAILMALASPVRAAEQAGQVKNGASAYRVCAACHSLQPGVHLSGPSLAELWGRKTATVAGYGRYTKALKQADIVWGEETLKAWLTGPGAMVPGTAMTFRGIEDNATRDDLVAFLSQALGEGGAARVVANGLVSEDLAAGQVPPSLKEVESDRLVTDIRHCGDGYYITTANGQTRPFWETSLRIKIDTSARGPGQGKPVLVRSGMVGDRASVVFPSLAALQQLLAEKCRD